MSASLDLSADTIQASADSSEALSAWCAQARAMQQAHKGHQWDIGDLLAGGEERFGRKVYKEAAAIFTDYKSNTLKEYASVARHVPAHIRIYGTLGWGHYQLVARFDNPELQEKLLVKAAEKGMAVSAFRKYINEKHPPAKKAGRQKSILVTLDESDLLWLRVIAFRADNCALAEAVALIVHDWQARWKAAYEDTPYVPAHPSLNEFYCKKAAA
jgi:hypothetical protein